MFAAKYLYLNHYLVDKYPLHRTTSVQSNCFTLIRNLSIRFDDDDDDDVVDVGSLHFLIRNHSMRVKRIN